MPVEVTCPTCGAKLKAPDAAIGKRAKCGKCRNPVLVTPPSTASSTPLPPPTGEPEPFPTLSESENPFDFGAPAPSNPSRPPASASTPAANPPPPAATSPSADVASPFAFASEQAPFPSATSPPPSKPSRYSQRDTKPAAASEKPPAEPPASRYRMARNQPASNRLLYVSFAGALLALILGVVSVYIFLDSSRRAAEAQQSKKSASDAASNDTPAPLNEPLVPQEKTDSPPTQSPPGKLPSNNSSQSTNSVSSKKDSQNQDKSTKSRPKDGKTSTSPGGKTSSQLSQTPLAPDHDPGPPPQAALLKLPTSIRTFTFAPAPAPREMADRVRHERTLPVPASTIQYFLPPANPNTDDAFVVYEQPGTEGIQPPRWVLEQISSVGTSVVRLEWEKDHRPVPLVAVHRGEKQSLCLAAIHNRVRVWDLNNKEVVNDNLAPFAGLPDAQTAEIAALYAVRDPQHFIAVASSGLAVVYDRSQGKVIHQFHPPQPQPGRVRWLRSTSSNSQQESFAIAIGGHLYHFRCDSQLSRLAEIPLGGDVQRSWAVAAEGERVIYVFDAGEAARQVRIILFATHQGQKSFRILGWPQEAGDPISATWSEATAILRATRGIVLLEHDEGNLIPFALLQPESGPVPYVTSHGSHLWYLLPDPKEPQNRTRACCLTLPLDDYAQFAERFQDKKPLPCLFLTPEGLKK